MDSQFSISNLGILGSVLGGAIPLKRHYTNRDLRNENPFIKTASSIRHSNRFQDIG